MYLDHVIPITESDLASRRSAALLREQLERLCATTVVHLDLSAVASISESYADELFGVLVRDYGIEHVLAHLHVRNAQPHVLRSIVYAIRQRLEASHGQQSIGLALLTARKALAERRSGRFSH